MRQPIERIEGERVTVLKDAMDARDPVSALAVDQVPDNVDRTPRLTALVRREPPLGQALKPGLQDARRACQQRGRLGQHETPARAIGLNGGLSRRLTMRHERRYGRQTANANGCRQRPVPS